MKLPIISVLLILVTQNLWAIDLFNGESLSGWKVLPGGIWTIEKQTLIGRQEATEKQHGMLLSEQRFKDFELTVIYKALEGNSGLYFRVDTVESHVSVHGFQAEIDHNGSNAGGLYETGGRSWVVKPKRELLETCYNQKGWNTMTVIAKGKTISVFLNGHQTAHLVNDEGRTEGHIGLQLHGGQKMHVEFRKIRLLELMGVKK